MLQRLVLVAVIAGLMTSGTAAQQNPLVIASVTTDATYLYISGVTLARVPFDLKDCGGERESNEADVTRGLAVHF